MKIGFAEKTEYFMKETIEKILEEKIIMIVRGMPTDKIIPLAEAMWRAGIRVMECTYDASGKTSDEEIAAVIGSLVKHFDGRMLVGAGTVLNKKQVALTKAAGGKFIISPDVNAEVIEETKRLGLVSIPGALTPSEATLANRTGADFVKLFPVSQMTPAYVKALCAPLSHIRFLSVGGVNADNLAEYVRAGTRGVGLSLNAKDKEAVIAGDFDYIENKCKALVDAASKA